MSIPFALHLPKAPLLEALKTPRILRILLDRILADRHAFLMKSLLLALWFTLLPISISARASSHEGPKQVIEKFYRRYLELGAKTSGTARPGLKYSKSLESLIAQNAEICRRKAEGEVCGFGADGDVYLDAQEVDPALTFRTARFSATESPDGNVEVRFNVYPSIKDATDSYKRRILFKMMKENGRWVVDDMIYGGKSARKQIAAEIERLKNSPATK